MKRVLDVRMRDGVLLSTSVETPSSDGPWPVLVARTPYSKEGMAKALSVLTHKGYAVVVQDVRGTGASGGIFSFLRDELADAADTGQWILEHPFCNGDIGLIGISYLGGASVGLAYSFPKNVKAAVWVEPVLSSQSILADQRVMQLHHNLPWAALGHPRFKDLDWHSLYRYLPLRDALRSAGIDSSLWDEICSYVMGESAAPDLTGAFDTLRVPGLHFGGFWDFMVEASLSAYKMACRPAGAPQTMFLGPWSHNGMAGEVTSNEYADYGEEASSAFARRAAQWFDHHLKGSDLPKDLSTPVAVYLPGEGWRRSASWPDPAVTNLDLYLGDCTLNPEIPRSGCSKFCYDPADPVPTEGGALWEFPRAGLNPGPAVVTTGMRPDVPVFESTELSTQIIAMGPAEVVLYAETGAAATDLTAKLIDVDARGTPRIVGDAISRVLGPGLIEVRLEIPAIGHIFEKGHRIRLDIASSNFPKFDRNLNTGVSDLVSTEMKIAHQVVRFGVAAPSRLRLSVIS